jgi:transcriptional regulator with XRE-family HTH domain
MSVSNDILWARHRLGYNVRFFRQVLEMTQGQLADQAKMDRAFISDVERGVVAASIDAIARLVDRI